MNPWRWVDPRVQSVRLAGVRSYLLGRGWELKPNPNPDFLRFEKPAGANGKPFYQVVPSSDRFSDFTHAMTLFLTSLSEIEDRHPVEILDEILRCQEAGTEKRQARVGTP